MARRKKTTRDIDPEYLNYLEWMCAHAEGHYEVGSDPELCDDLDCPYSPTAHDPNEDQPL